MMGKFAVALVLAAAAAAGSVGVQTRQSFISSQAPPNCTCVDGYRSCMDVFLKKKDAQWCKADSNMVQSFCCAEYDDCCEVDLTNTISIATSFFVATAFTVVCVCYCCNNCPPKIGHPRYLRHNMRRRESWEESDLCLNWGKVGVDQFDTDHRSNVMALTAMAAFVSFVCQAPAFCSLSLRETDVQKTAWTTADATTADSVHVSYYASLRGAFVCTKRPATTEKCEEIRWDADICRTHYMGPDQCDECRRAGWGVSGCVFLGVFFALIHLYVSLARTTAYGDLNHRKMMGAFSGVMVVLSLMAALSTWEEACRQHQPESLLLDGSVVVPMHRVEGPSMVCVIAATVITFFSVVSHCVLPTPEERSTPGYKLLEHSDAIHNVRLEAYRAKMEVQRKEREQLKLFKARLKKMAK